MGRQINVPQGKTISPKGTDCRPVARREYGGKNLPVPEPEHRFSKAPALRVLALAVLLTIVAAPSLFSVIDNDIWWHLKVGDWIIEHANVPRAGILSRTAADQPWMAYSWIYEVLLSFFHSRFHLIGIGIYGLLLTLAVAYSTFWMVRRLSGSFWRAGLLATVTCAAFLFNVYPRPVFFSMTLFAVTLTLLLEARRTGRPQLLYWLPPLFVLWANAHIQFVYGLFLVGLFVAVSILQRAVNDAKLTPDFWLTSSLSTSTLLAILGACVLATCIGPYSYRLYFVVFGYVKAKFPYTFIGEFQALRFRHYADFVQLLLTGFAFYALGRAKKTDPFLLALLSIASIVGFRTARDSWFICLPAAACIAETLGGAKRTYSETIAEKFGLAAAVALLLTLYSRSTGFNSPNLRLAINDVYPVQAVNFLHDHPQRGPLYNTFDWGGFISWYMPEYPVAIDGRTDLYGDEIDTRFYLTENGDASYVDDPYLEQANLFLLPRGKALARLLASDARFDVIYQDSLAMVLVRR